MKAALLARLQAARAEGRPVAVLTRLSDGAQHLHPEDTLPEALRRCARRPRRRWPATPPRR
ncbi:hypothetical protein ACFFMP_18225 [Pseudoroseomonas cervicalis]|uniref:hypothetical protein n=1 Tax=Teichococcus cervicalis TaxID=204525 RepID=UPI0035EA8972